MPLPLSAPLDTLSDAEQTVLHSYLETVRFAADERIITAGEAGDSLYLIDDGVVRVEVDDTEIDTEAVVGFVEAGGLVGELSLLDRLPRSAHAVAHTDVAARRLTADAIDRIAAEHPRIGISLVLALGRDVSRKLRATTRRLADLLLEESADPEVDAYVERAHAAQRQIEGWDDARIDALLERIASAVALHAAELAADTVRETHIGDVGDKAYKNYIAAMAVYHSLAGRAGGGPLRHDAERGITEIGSAAGVIFAIIPMTNPVATAVFKTLIAIKARNALVLSFHRAALGVGNRTGEIMRAAVEAAGAPPDLVQWVTERASRRKTHSFMSHPGIGLILATGGAGLVRAAYSSGTPALGVGPGNAPAWICDDADLPAAAAAVVASKSFDNGLICGAEHNLVVDASVREAFIEALERSGAAVLSDAETKFFAGAVVDPATRRFSPRIAGQNAASIAQFLGIRRDHPIRVIVVPSDDPDAANPFAGEKLAPLLSLFTVTGREAGLGLCRRLLEQWGTGHTAMIHSRDDALIDRFALEMPASRVLVNSPGTQGVVGLTTGLNPSFTLGCGTFGRNSTTDNVSFTNLMNVKRLARYIEPSPAAHALEQQARAAAARVSAEMTPA